MPDLVSSKVLESIVIAHELYHQLVLLVGLVGSGKTKTLQDVAKRSSSQVFNVNLSLSARLIELTAKQRALRLPGLLDQITSEAQSPLLLDNLEILFDKDLHQDPLKLLQGLSRNRTVVASWNGTSKSGKLEYAVPGHPEYRCYETADLLMVNIDGTTSIDLENNFREIGQA